MDTVKEFICVLRIVWLGWKLLHDNVKQISAALVNISHLLQLLQSDFMTFLNRFLINTLISKKTFQNVEQYFRCRLYVSLNQLIFFSFGPQSWVGRLNLKNKKLFDCVSCACGEMWSQKNVLPLSFDKLSNLKVIEEKLFVQQIFISMCCWCFSFIKWKIKCESNDLDDREAFFSGGDLILHRVSFTETFVKAFKNKFFCVNICFLSRTSCRYISYQFFFQL